jgi:transcriptional regulator with XRE-family HTH domain
MNKFWNIGRNLKDLRERAGLTQRELAEAVNTADFNLDITQPYITGLEKSRGDKLPSVPVLAALAKVLGVKMEDICGVDIELKPDPLSDLTEDDRRNMVAVIHRLIKLNHLELDSKFSGLTETVYTNGGRKQAVKIEGHLGVELPITDTELAGMFK